LHSETNLRTLPPCRSRFMMLLYTLRYKKIFQSAYRYLLIYKKVLRRAQRYE
jgi:hypothetical protein